MPSRGYETRHYPVQRQHHHDRERRKSRNASRDRSTIARQRQSLTPDAERRMREGSAAMRHTPSTHLQKGLLREEKEPRAPPPKPRERSLSPFSKRKALTQAMSGGR